MKPGGGVEGFVSADGWLYKYDRNTNDFAIGRPEGFVSTLFKPKPGLTYWKGEKRKHGFK